MNMVHSIFFQDVTQIERPNILDTITLNNMLTNREHVCTYLQSSPLPQCSVNYFWCRKSQLSTWISGKRLANNVLVPHMWTGLQVQKSKVATCNSLKASCRKANRAHKLICERVLNTPTLSNTRLQTNCQQAHQPYSCSLLFCKF